MVVMTMTTRIMRSFNYSYDILLCLFLFTTLTTTTTSAMHRTDTSNYFLFIEPDASQKSAQPVNDELTQSVQDALKLSTKGTSRYSDLQDIPGTFQANAGSYRGFHIAEDGSVSDTSDHLLPNGFITNSLCVHYVQWYRDTLSDTEMEKLQALHEFMQKHPPPKGGNAEL
eukprot:scaffold1508_cov178-Amphora_coffeaeformis.AAC.5